MVESSTRAIYLPPKDTSGLEFLPTIHLWDGSEEQLSGSVPEGSGWFPGCRGYDDTSQVVTCHDLFSSAGYRLNSDFLAVLASFFFFF